mgnify:CR=1 FL=1
MNFKSFFKIRENFLEFFYFSGFFDLRKTHNFGFKVLHIRRNVLLQRENNVFVPQKHRDAFRVGTFFYQPCSKGVPQHVKVHMANTGGL